MIEGVDFTVSYTPGTGIKSLRIIITIVSAEDILIFKLEYLMNYIILFYSDRKKWFILVYHIFVET